MSLLYCMMITLSVVTALPLLHYILTRSERTNLLMSDGAASSVANITTRTRGAIGAAISITSLGFALAGISYLYSNNLAQLQFWQNGLVTYETLIEYKRQNSLTRDQQIQFLITQRYRLSWQRDNLIELLSLAENAVTWNQTAIANDVLTYAYRHYPTQSTVSKQYGLFLLQYGKTALEKDRAKALLEHLLLQNPNDLAIIKALAFYALQSKDQTIMVYYWNMWLQKLPIQAPERAMVAHTVTQIEQGLLH